MFHFGVEATAFFGLFVYLCYNRCMYNWSVDENNLKKSPEKYVIWHLEQMLNFGLNGEKIKKSDLITYLPKLNIDPIRREFINLLLYGKFNLDNQAKEIS